MPFRSVAVLVAGGREVAEGGRSRAAGENLRDCRFEI